MIRNADAASSLRSAGNAGAFAHRNRDARPEGEGALGASPIQTPLGIEELRELLAGVASGSWALSEDGSAIAEGAGEPVMWANHPDDEWARNDKDLVLAANAPRLARELLELKARLLELHEQESRSTAEEVWGHPGICGSCRVEWPCPTIEALG